MSKHSNEVFTGISLPLTEERKGNSGGTLELSDNDISRLDGVSLLYRAIRSSYKDRFGKPFLQGAEIRMAMLAKEGEVPYSPSQFLADLQITAKQLQANAEREEPLPHCKVLSHVSIGKVLEALSAANRKAGTRLYVCTPAGEAEVPILNPSDFIQPIRADAHKQTGTYVITGLCRDPATGQCGFLLTGSRVDVRLPQADLRWSWSAIKNALDHPTFLVGTISRAGRSSHWTPEEGARLESQEGFPGMPLGGVA